ncbi:MAG: hypothetical protein A2Y12_00060 [Planctomycetes bacterium GWF2_42_9]|nr:MAG: hypothetical protein A2Y12_00060 [Planctomycetes bacterium GWF2_42_9]
MLRNKWTIITVLFCCIGIVPNVIAAGWAWESTSSWNNVLTTDYIGSYEFDIGNTNRTWYWDGGWAITLVSNPTNQMYFYDSDGSQCKTFQLKFQFTRPITSFQFVTPQKYNNIIDTNSTLYWSYSTDGTNWTTLWQYTGVNTNGLGFAPVETPIQKFLTSDNITHIWIRYFLAKGNSYGYGGGVYFYDSVDDGGLIRVTVGDEFSAGDAYSAGFEDCTLTNVTGQGTLAWTTAYQFPGGEASGTIVNTESYSGYKSLYQYGVQTNKLDLGTQYVDEARWFEFAFKFIDNSDNQACTWVKTVRGSVGDVEGIRLKFVRGGYKVICNDTEIGQFTPDQWQTISFRHDITNYVFNGFYDVYLNGDYKATLYTQNGYDGLETIVFSSLEDTWLHNGQWCVDDIHIGEYPAFVDTKGYAAVIGSDYSYQDYIPRQLWNVDLMKMGYKPVILDRDDVNDWKNSLNNFAMILFSATYNHSASIDWGNELGTLLKSWITNGGYLVFEGAHPTEAPVDWVDDINSAWTVSVRNSALAGVPDWIQPGLLYPHTLPDGVELNSHYIGRHPSLIGVDPINGGLNLPYNGWSLTHNTGGYTTTWANGMGNGSIVVTNYFQGYCLNLFLLEDILRYCSAAYIPAYEEGPSIAEQVATINAYDPNHQSPSNFSINSDGVLVIDGTKQFPLGFFYVIYDGSMQMMVNEGFDFAWGSNDSLYNNSNYASLKTTSSILGFQAGSNIPPLMDDYIQEEQIICWDLAEEPENSGALQTNYQLKLVNDIAKKIDPNRFTMLMMNDTLCFEQYAEIADVFAIDPYCIYNSTSTLETLAGNCQMARYYSGNKPLWTMLQTHYFTPTGLVKPTKAQLRGEMYVALANHSKAIAWFVLDYIPGVPENSYLRDVNDWIPAQEEQKTGVFELKSEYDVIKSWLTESDSTVSVSTSGNGVYALCFTKSSSPEHLLVVVNARSTSVSNATISWPLVTTNYEDAFIALHNSEPNIPLSPSINVNTDTNSITVSLSGYQRGVYKFSLLPNQASAPSPSNSATGASINPMITWTVGQGATSHDVYFGTNQTDVNSATHASAEYKGNKTDPNYLPTGNLSSNTTYYWRIDEVDSYGATKGSVWTFTTTNNAPSFVAIGAVVHSTAGITPPLPSGIATNDILLMFVETYNQIVSISNPNGGTWSQITSSPQGTTGTRLTVFWSRYNGTQGTPTTNDSGDHQIGRIIAIRRGTAAYGTPWDVTSGGVESTSDTTGSIPGTTTTVANTLVVTAIATSLPDYNYDNNRFSSWTNANLASLTERVDCSRDSGNGGGFGIATGVKATAGAYGNTAVSLATSATKGMMSIAIKP